MRSIKFLTLVLRVFASYIIVTKQKNPLSIEMKTLLASRILSIFIIYVNGESQVTLTTATECDSECLKPTSLHRRIQEDRSVEVTQSTPLVNFRAKDDKLRRNRSEIWKWDYWCQLQPKTGSCSEKLQKFYYDAQLDLCKTFRYSGCNGNKNNFDSLMECERYCKGAAFMEVKEMEESALCSLQPNAGLCLATFTKYYYDINEATCKKYIYGGCGGNENRFDTKYKCLKRCDKVFLRD